MLETLKTQKEELPQKVAIKISTAADISELSVPHLWNEIKAGKIPVVRPGGSRAVRIMFDDFLNYLKGDQKK